MKPPIHSASSLSKLGQRATEPPISWLMKMAIDRPQLISLAAGFTDSDSLPVDEARALMNEMLGSANSGRAALQYGSTSGDADLIRLTIERLLALEGAKAASQRAYDPQRVVITHGSQQFLYLISEALCDPGDIVLVEDPTYFVFLGILQIHGVRTRGVPVTPDGMDLTALEKVLESLRRRGELPKLKLLYLVSYFQNPSGVTTALEKKEAALKLLRRYERDAGHPIYLLEDAAYRELRFSGPEIPSALSLPNASSRVIYTGTYSKPFATGVRVGFGLLPETLLRVVYRIKGNHDFGTSNLLQRLLAMAMATGRYEKHLPLLRRRYASKAAAMIEALKQHFPSSVQWLAPEGGMYIWAQLPKAIQTGPKSKFFRRVFARDVFYVPGEFCYAEDPARSKPRHEMRLSFGSASESNIREGIARMGAVLKELT
jgi:2-aminoadipate transaminase